MLPKWVVYFGVKDADGVKARLKDCMGVAFDKNFILTTTQCATLGSTFVYYLDSRKGPEPISYVNYFDIGDYLLLPVGYSSADERLAVYRLSEPHKLDEYAPLNLNYTPSSADRYARIKTINLTYNHPIDIVPDRPILIADYTHYKTNSYDKKSYLSIDNHGYRKETYVCGSPLLVNDQMVGFFYNGPHTTCGYIPYRDETITYVYLADESKLLKSLSTASNKLIK